jgi:dienelactone hydrolase
MQVSVHGFGEFLIITKLQMEPQMRSFLFNSSRVAGSVFLQASILLGVLVNGALAQEEKPPNLLQPKNETANSDSEDGKDERTASKKKVEPKEIAVELIELSVQGKFQEATEHFDFVMSQLLPPVAMKQTWAGITAQYGNYVEHGEPVAEAIAESTLVRIACKFERGSLEARVSFNSKNKIQGFFLTALGAYHSPSYVDANKFEGEEVEVGEGLMKLPGTLTVPKGAGRFPGVVLVQGSGPSDRDETVGPNKPFRDIAEGLSSQGIAVVRYEKRTKQFPLMAVLSLSSFTVHEETVHDAAEAVALLRKHPKIDPDRIYVVGHSLGGWMLPRIYEASKPVTGLVSLAGSARPLEDLILEQVHYLAETDGNVTDEEKEQLEKVREQVQQVKAEDLSKKTLSSKLPLSIAPAYWLDLRGYDAPKLARDIPARWLLLQGERDYQVIDKDLSAWEVGLKGHADVTIKRYPKLNHLFMAGEGPCRPAEYFQEANVDEAVIRDIAQWIQTPHP